jgi:UDP-glucose 4-epimerase
MKILVSGGAGFIGSHIADLYISRGHKVVVIDNLSAGRIANLNPEATFYKADIRSKDIEKIFEIEKPDIVNHQAAQISISQSILKPILDAEVNILGSLNLIECAIHHKIKRFIYASPGLALYGEPQYLPCDENHPINPTCQHGASKHAVEHYLHMYNINYGLAYTIFRYPNVYGPRQDTHPDSGVVAIFSGKMLARQHITINGNGEQVRDFLYVSDCAMANLLALNETESNIYNLGSMYGTSINTIFTTLKSLTNYDLTPINGPSIVGEINKIYLDSTKAQQKLGWKPDEDIFDGLRKTVDYYNQRDKRQN